MGQRTNRYGLFALSAMIIGFMLPAKTLDAQISTTAPSAKFDDIRDPALVAGAKASLNKDYAEAFRQYQAAADAGNAMGMYLLGALYHEGHGVPQNYALAKKWFEQASVSGNSAAMYGLGQMYEHGNGVKQDYPEALKWYRKAADVGHVDGILEIGIFYAFGRGASGIT